MPVGTILGSFGSAVDLAEVRPETYLREGFFAADGRLRDGLSGIYSLATARHLVGEAVPEKDFAAFVRRVEALVERENPGGEGLTRALPVEARSVLEAAGRESVPKSATLRSLLSVSLGRGPQWRDVVALVVHLRRVHQQLTYLSVLGREP